MTSRCPQALGGHAPDHLPLLELRRTQIVPIGHTSARVSPSAGRLRPRAARTPRAGDRHGWPNSCSVVPTTASAADRNPMPVVAVPHHRRGVAQHVGDQFEGAPSFRSSLAHVWRSSFGVIPRYPGRRADVCQLPANASGLTETVPRREGNTRALRVLGGHVVRDRRTQRLPKLAVAGLGKPRARCEAGLRASVWKPRPHHNCRAGRQSPLVTPVGHLRRGAPGENAL